MASDEEELRDALQRLEDLDRQIDRYVNAHPELKTVGPEELRKHPWLDQLLRREEEVNNQAARLERKLGRRH